MDPRLSLLYLLKSRTACSGCRGHGICYPNLIVDPAYLYPSDNPVALVGIFSFGRPYECPTCNGKGVLT